MTPVVEAERGGWSGLVRRHRPLAVLLPVSLILSWAIALGHGPAAVPPSGQGLLAHVLEAIVGSPILRMLWWLWLAGALVLIESLARRFGARDLVILAIGGMLIVSPVTFWAFGWMGVEGPLIFFGALAIWLGSKAADRRASAWWLVLVGLLAGAFGIAAAVVFLLVLLQMISVAVVRRRGWGSLVAPAAVALGVSIVLPAFAAIAGIGAAPGTPAATGGQTLGPVGSLLSILNAMVDIGLGSLSHGGVGLPGAPEYFYVALGWVIVAGVLIAFFQARRTREIAPLAVATAASVLLAGPLLLLLVRVLHGDWLVLLPPGAAGLLPAFLVVTATVIRNRVAAWLVIGWSAVIGVLNIVLALTATW